MKKTFTPGQVAKICDVAPRTVAKWIDSDKLKGYRIPGSQDRRVPRENLIRFLKENGMPLGDLEEEQLYKVLIIGACGLFENRMFATLNDSDKYKLEYAASPFQAGRLIDAFAPDAVVIDLSLGRSESIQIAAHLRQADSHTNTLIVAVTGEDELYPEELKEYGFDIVSPNPLDPTSFIDQIIARRKAKQEGN